MTTKQMEAEDYEGELFKQRLKRRNKKEERMNKGKLQRAEKNTELRSR